MWLIVASGYSITQRNTLEQACKHHKSKNLNHHFNTTHLSTSDGFPIGVRFCIWKPRAATVMPPPFSLSKSESPVLVEGNSVKQTKERQSAAARHTEELLTYSLARHLRRRSCCR